MNRFLQCLFQSLPYVIVVFGSCWVGCVSPSDQTVAAESRAVEVTVPYWYVPTPPTGKDDYVRAQWEVSQQIDRGQKETAQRFNSIDHPKGLDLLGRIQQGVFSETDPLMKVAYVTKVAASDPFGKEERDVAQWVALAHNPKEMFPWLQAVEKASILEGFAEAYRMQQTDYPHPKLTYDVATRVITRFLPGANDSVKTSALTQQAPEQWERKVRLLGFFRFLYRLLIRNKDNGFNAISMTNIEGSMQSIVKSGALLLDLNTYFNHLFYIHMVPVAVHGYRKLWCSECYGRQSLQTFYKKFDDVDQYVFDLKNTAATNQQTPVLWNYFLDNPDNKGLANPSVLNRIINANVPGISFRYLECSDEEGFFLSFLKTWLVSLQRAKDDVPAFTLEEVQRLRLTPANPQPRRRLRSARE